MNSPQATALVPDQRSGIRRWWLDRSVRVAFAASAVTTAAAHVLADAVNAETGVRGYAATRDPLFLAPYRLTLARIGADRALLRDAAATQGDSRQERALSDTTTRVMSELVRLRSTVGGGVSLRVLVPALVTQKRTMDLLRRQTRRAQG
jgi:CHASE3 domain